MALGRAFVPPIPGLADSKYDTNQVRKLYGENFSHGSLLYDFIQTIFNLAEVPKRMVVVGAVIISLERNRSVSLYDFDFRLYD